MISLLLATFAFAGAPAIGVASNLSGVAHLKSREEMGIICKTITEEKCPYCSHERCHDDKHQWDSDIYSCPAVMCPEEHTEKYNPEDWKK